MQISATKKIIIEDFPQAARDVAQKLATIFNSYLDQTTTALNGGLTIADNLKSKIFRQQLASGASVLKLAWSLNERPTSVIVAQLTRTDGVIPPVFALHWLYADGILTCTFTGLGAAIHNVVLVAQV